MTLADLIRQYLEDRRKYYAKKTWFLEQNNFLPDSSTDSDDRLVTVDNKQYFSNNIDPKNDSTRGFPQSTLTRQVGVSRSRRIINLPDGSIEIVTIIRDSNGNEEKHVTTQKGDKKHTIITRKDAAGVERTEEKVTDVNDSDNIGFDSLIPPSSRPDFQNGADSGYDFWFRKFFKPEDTPSNDDLVVNENSPFDFSANPDEQIEKILKKFAQGKYFDPFSEIFKNNDYPKDKDGFKEMPSPGDFPKFGDSLLNEETRKLIENFEKSTANSPKNSKKKKNHHLSPKQMERLLKSITPPPPPSMFEQFAENAMTEIPEEETPLDRFVKLDEDQRNSMRKIRREQDEAIKKLNKYFSSKPDSSAKDVYSDIDDGRDADFSADFSLVLPKPKSRMVPNDFGEMLRRTLDGNLYDGSSQTRMFIENGKKRIESVRKNAEGLTEKTISYEIGNQRYSVVIVTDKFGKQIKRDRNFNFSEGELSNFKKQWSKNFHSDFDD